MNRSIQLITAKFIKYNPLLSPNLYFLLMLKVTSCKFYSQLICKKVRKVRRHKRDACAREVKSTYYAILSSFVFSTNVEFVQNYSTSWGNERYNLEPQIPNIGSWHSNKLMILNMYNASNPCCKECKSQIWI